MSKSQEVLVVGAGGLQAQAFLTAVARADGLEGWVGLDREWPEDRRSALEDLGVAIETCDLVDEPDRLLELVSTASVVANFAGPFYRTGAVVLDACIEAGTDYVDICDDADATLQLLERDEAARLAGVHALIGMGSSPGVTNVLVRAAVDALGSADEVSISWVVDIADVGNAALQHFWHIFALFGPDGVRRPVASWEKLSTREVNFPEPVGVSTLLELSHPEPLTIPRSLPVERVVNYGGITPDDALIISWALARIGADGEDVVEIDGRDQGVSEVALALYQLYVDTREPTAYNGSGLAIDVLKGDTGFRFLSGDTMSMEESTGTPAAAGVLLMLEGRTAQPGVFAPEQLDPAAFFPTLGRVSRSTGSLELRRIENGEPTERLRIRDLFSKAAV